MRFITIESAGKFAGILTVSVAALALCGAGAQANESGFTAHHLVPAEPYAQEAKTLPSAEKMELRKYLDYEQREPCQGYQPTPQEFVESGCRLSVNRPPPPVAEVPPRAAEPVQGLRPVIAHYTVYFDHDRSNIRPDGQDTLARVAREIKEYTPFEVTIAGHADRSGSSEYNEALSKKRAQTVSAALTGAGVPNRILEKLAYGETDPAIPTPDGVQLEENRRVVIQFRK